jgi:hypothetical protein
VECSFCVVGKNGNLDLPINLQMLYAYPVNVRHVSHLLACSSFCPVGGFV